MFLDLICVLRTKSDDFKNLVTKVIQLNLIFLLIRFDQKEQKNSIMNEKLSFISKRFKKPLWEFFLLKTKLRPSAIFVRQIKSFDCIIL